jgi:hypothetical protein
MTPQEEMNTPGPKGAAPAVTNVNTRLGTIRAASIICLLAGIWLFVSPWVYGATGGNTWNSWLVGAAIFLLGIVRVARPAFSTGISWVNAVLGAWVLCSPWIYGYTANSGRLINSVCVGIVVLVFSVASGIGASRLVAVPPRQ